MVRTELVVRLQGIPWPTCKGSRGPPKGGLYLAASGPPAVKSSRPSLTFLIETSDPLDSTTFPANVVNVTFSPASRSFGPHPCRRTVFGLVISRFHVVTLPALSV